MSQTSESPAVIFPGAVGHGGLRRWMEVVEIDTRLLAMIATLIVICGIFGILTGGIFLTPRNLFNLTLQTSVVAIMATGMVVVIIARHIDLSVGSQVGFLGVLAATLQVHVFPSGASYNWIASLLLTLLAGAVVGAIHGYWVAYRGLPSFIVTLAGLLGWRGAAWLLAKGTNISPMEERFQLLGGRPRRHPWGLLELGCRHPRHLGGNRPCLQRAGTPPPLRLRRASACR